MFLATRVATAVCVGAFFCGFCTVSALGQSAPASDQQVDLLEEIIVSDFRERARFGLSASIAVLDAQFIDETAVQHFEELTQFVPNLNWAGGVSRARYFQIRGIGERSQYEGAPNPSVGFIIDDLDVSGLGGIATLFDAQQVEVLRGPQGTRFGANALAGLIYLKYQEPTDVFDARVSTTVGSDDTRGVGVAFGGPLNEAWAYRAVLQQQRSNGFRDNAFLDRDDTNGRDELSTRVKVRYAPTDRWQVDLTALHADIDNGYDAFAVDNSFTTQSNRPGQDAQRTTALVLSADAALGDSLRVRSITGAARSDVIFSFDADWGNDAFWDPVIYDYFSSTRRDRQTLSQEFRLLSDDSDGPVDWVAGVLLRNDRESNITVDDGNFEGFLDAGFIAREYEATSVALFGDIDVVLSDRLGLNAGLRVEQRDADYVDTQGDQFDPDESSVGGQIALLYDWTDQLKVYGKVARGYKAGGFNLGLPDGAPQSSLLFDAEFLWNYELGFEATLWDDRVALDANVFWMERTDQQVQTSSQIDPNNPATFVFFTDNAGKGRNRGIELTADFAITEQLSLYANLGLLDTEIRELENAAAIEGRDQAHAPGYSFAVGGRVDFARGWFARVDVTGRDAFFFSDSHNQRSEAYSLLNARVGYERGNWYVSAWARNLLDETYAVRGFFFGNEPARDFADTLYTRQGDPRSVGISFEWRTD